MNCMCNGSTHPVNHATPAPSPPPGMPSRETNTPPVSSVYKYPNIPLFLLECPSKLYWEGVLKRQYLTFSAIFDIRTPASGRRARAYKYWQSGRFVLQLHCFCCYLFLSSLSKDNPKVQQVIILLFCSFLIYYFID